MIQFSDRYVKLPLVTKVKALIAEAVLSEGVGGGGLTDDTY